MVDYRFIVYPTVSIYKIKVRKKRNYYQAKNKDYKETFQKTLRSDGSEDNNNIGITNYYRNLIFFNQYFTNRVWEDNP